MFTDELRACADEVWEAQHAHPFVTGIGDGTLSEERFAHWVRQDHLFLIDYARLLALGAARAPDLPTMRRFAELTQAILGEEMELHRALAASLGIAQAELDAEPAAPATAAYCDFLLRTAALGELGELAAALLPCMWGYSEVGERLAARGAPGHEHYDAWIATYADPAFAEQASWCRDLVNALAAEAGPAVRSRMSRAFLASSRLELEFWEMGWTLQRRET
ncbi:MAG: thiaminase II [Solirubrobacterales bacterium]|nr:thiaminase II [Solirubrobacterales bacterium]